MRTKTQAKDYNQKYYIKNRDLLIKKSAEYQKNPINAEKRRERRRKRYKTNDKGFRDRNLKSHDKCKQNPLWLSRQRVKISVWGLLNRTSKINKDRWDKYYTENKEKYKLYKKNAFSSKVNQALSRVRNNHQTSKENLINDINILKFEIARLKQ